jgi:glycosyltransferase involved in cell wall biosynthesis
MKKVLFIFNGMNKNGGVLSISGGDIRLLEMVKNAKNIEINLLTTPNGIEFMRRYDQDYHKAYIIDYVINSGIVSNFLISLKALLLYKTKASQFKNGIVYSSCEHLYDVLPAMRLKLFNHCEWYAVYHWVEDYPWREKRGNTPLLNRYAYWLNRYVAGLMIKLFATQILAVSDQTKDKLVEIKKIKPSRIKAVYCGVEFARIREIVNKYRSEQGAQYDAVFMKRLNYGKGIKDLLEIWLQVVRKKPTAKLAVIGDGSEEVVSQVRQFITDNGLEKNIDILGVVYDIEKKFRLLLSSKLFLLPTHEENWAIVIGEAMTCEVPVVVSRLKEIESIWQDNVIWCGVGQTDEFANAVINLLDDPAAAKLQAQRALKFIERYDWKKIAADEFVS